MQEAATEVPAQHIQAAIRLRPLLPSEQARGEEACLSLIPLSAMDIVVPSPQPSSSSSPAGTGAVVGGPDFGIRASVPLVRAANDNTGPSTDDTAALRGPRLRPGGTAKGVQSTRARTALAAHQRVQDFCYDLCLGPEASQSATFEALRVVDYCDDAMDGRAATILCFGQTGSGKTFTLSGGTLSAPAEAETDAIMVAEDGLQYRAVQYLVQRLAARRAEANVASVVAKCAYIELYNESLCDLLQGTSGLKCRWSAASEAFFVDGCLLVECTSLDDFLLVLREGQASRHRAGHLLNADSSRSHVLFTVYMETSYRDGTPRTYGKLTFVDLAGSERLSDTGSDGEDTKSINKSLFALGHVIETLSRQEKAHHHAQGAAKEKKKAPVTSAEGSAGEARHAKRKTDFVPYRSSVLTQLLMDSLGGRCRTLMVACVTPSSRFYEESLKTLRYAQRMRCIAAAPVRRVDVREAERYGWQQRWRASEHENAMLRRCLGLPRAAEGGEPLTEADVTAHLKQLLERYAQSRLASGQARALASQEARKPTSAPAQGSDRARLGVGPLTPLSPVAAALRLPAGRRTLPALSPMSPTAVVPAVSAHPPVDPHSRGDASVQTADKEAELGEEYEDAQVPDDVAMEVDMGDVDEEVALSVSAPHMPALPPPPPPPMPPAPVPLPRKVLAPVARGSGGFSVLDMLNALPDAAPAPSSAARPQYGFRSSIK